MRLEAGGWRLETRAVVAESETETVAVAVAGA
jgi:hypothetical protein